MIFAASGAKNYKGVYEKAACFFQFSLCDFIFFQFHRGNSLLLRLKKIFFLTDQQDFAIRNSDGFKEGRPGAREIGGAAF